MEEQRLARWVWHFPYHDPFEALASEAGGHLRGPFHVDVRIVLDSVERVVSIATGRVEG